MKGGIWLLIRLPYNDHVVDDIAGFYIVIDILLTMGGGMISGQCLQTYVVCIINRLTPLLMGTCVRDLHARLTMTCHHGATCKNVLLMTPFTRKANNEVFSH